MQNDLNGAYYESGCYREIRFLLREISSRSGHTAPYWKSVELHTSGPVINLYLPVHMVYAQTLEIDLS